jgi:DNA processing protein
MTQILSASLGEQGYVVVSGLARGVDAAAHRAALPTGTVAVLAGGLDRIYPPENVPLVEEIQAAGGMILTEMPLGWEPRAQDFPRRNRLVSGLSLGVVVVEAARRSGSLITARLALEQNREVFAVPGSPLDPRADGGNHLIQQGAKLVTSAADIVESLLPGQPPRQLLEPDWEPEASSYLADIDPTSDDRSRLMSALSVTPMPVDDLISTTGLQASVVQVLLLELDLAGRIEWSSGQLVALRE